MADGADLGLALAKAKTPSELSGVTYESAMQERAKEEWEGSMQKMGVLLSDSSPAAAVKMKELMAGGGPPDESYVIAECATVTHY